MTVIKTAKNGIVNNETIFSFHQNGMMVKADYFGGNIEKGYLIGIIEDNLLQFVYCQQRKTGQLDHGESLCILSTDEKSGKLILKEQFKMNTQKSNEVGVNVFMEL